MAPYLRKLIGPSPDDDKLCKKHCDADKNPSNICPPSCIDLYVCPDVCKFPPPGPNDVDFGSQKSPRVSLLLTISLSALAAAFFLFTCYTIYKLYSNWRSCRRRRRLQESLHQEDDRPDEFLDEDQGPVVDHHVWYIRTIGLQPSVIGAITIVKYKKGDGLIESTDCSVCLSEFEENETLRLLPKCNHAFHVMCIDTWLRSHTNCPMCRAGIVSSSARLSSPQVQNPGLGSAVEPQNGITGSNIGVGTDSETELPTTELRIGIDDETISRTQTGSKSLDGPQPFRRSISVDSLSAVAISFPGQADRNIDTQLVEVKESTMKRAGLNQGPSIERSMQTGSSVSMKRSLSCSANVFLSRHSNRNRS